ncbi:hypothetical protein LTS18_012506, partial [Coniosporium uncinatum]
MAEGPSTPPHNGNLPKNPVTPEQVRRMEEARLRAKARAQEANRTASTDPQAGQKRSHAMISRSNVPSTRRDATIPGIADSRSGGGMSKPPADNDLIRPAKKFDKYIEYDFSKMTDTK